MDWEGGHTQILDKAPTYQTSFRSPIGSRWKLRTKFDHHYALNCVPRLFGVLKNKNNRKECHKSMAFDRSKRCQERHVDFLKSVPNQEGTSGMWGYQFIIINMVLGTCYSLVYPIRSNYGHIRVLYCPAYSPVMPLLGVNSRSMQASKQAFQSVTNFAGKMTAARSSN